MVSPGEQVKIWVHYTKMSEQGLGPNWLTAIMLLSTPWAAGDRKMVEFEPCRWSWSGQMLVQLLPDPAAALDLAFFVRA